MDSGSENDRRRKVLRLLKMSRLVVFLSRIEGWGLVPLEGLACGLPVVAYALPVYKEHIRACDVAFLVPIGDYQKAATVILDILNKQQSELQEMSRKAKDFASQYDWDRLAGSAIRIIVEL
jgi:glycosyltransferase involved in cell wall biosynthesis